MEVGAGLDLPQGPRALSSGDELRGGRRPGRPGEGCGAPGRSGGGARGYRRAGPGRLQADGESLAGPGVGLAA